MHIHDPNLEAYIQQRFAMDPARGALREISKMSGAEKRREPRSPTNDLGMVRLLHPLAWDHSAIHICEVSKVGIKFHSERFIEPGTEVQIKLKDMLVMGEVRHCIQVDGFFAVGVLVDDVLRPTEKGPGV